MSAAGAWKSIKDGIAEYAPLVAQGISLVNPAAGTAVGLVAKLFGGSADDPEGLAAAVAGATPEQKLALIAEGNRNREALLAEANRHDEAVGGQDVVAIQAVNETMRSEIVNSASESWYQKGWRPACGFSLAVGSLASVLYVCALFWHAMSDPATVGQVVAILPGFAMAVASILSVPGAAVGIAAWQRGRMQVEQAKAGGAV